MNDTHTNGNSSALAIAKPAALVEENPYEPQSIGDAFKMATAMVESQFLPKAIKTPQQALAIMVAGKELGFTMMQSFRLLYIFDGKIGLYADAMVGLIMSKGVAEYFMVEETTATVARYVTKRKGAPGEQRYSFTIDDAKRAGLTDKDIWKKYPAAMLRGRCITALARIVYPDVVAGIYDPEEIQSETAPTPPPPPKSAPAPKAAPVAPALSPEHAAMVAAWEQRLLAANTTEEIQAVHAEVVAAVKKDSVLKESKALSTLRKLEEERAASVKAQIPEAKS